jgi:hypothetical protein
VDFDAVGVWVRNIHSGFESRPFFRHKNVASFMPFFTLIWSNLDIFMWILLT